MSSEEALLQISGKLDRILGFLAVRDVQDVGERIARLRALGLDNTTIATVTGMTANAVAVRIHRMQAGGKPSKSPKHSE